MNLCGPQRLTLGHYWTDAGDTQWKRFISGMRQLLACTYSTTFSHYAGQKVEWLQPRWSDDRDYVEIRVHSSERQIASSGRLPAMEKQRTVEALRPSGGRSEPGGELVLNVQPVAPGA